MNWLQRKLFKVRTGADISVLNDGKTVDELVIKYGDYYFGIMLDGETGVPTGDFAWSESPTNFPATPIREYLEAKPMYAKKKMPHRFKNLDKEIEAQL